MTGDYGPLDLPSIEQLTGREDAPDRLPGELSACSLSWARPIRRRAAGTRTRRMCPGCGTSWGCKAGVVRYQFGNERRASLHQLRGPVGRPYRLTVSVREVQLATISSGTRRARSPARDVTGNEKITARPDYRRLALSRVKALIFIDGLHQSLQRIWLTYYPTRARIGN